jgi:hypothetical protein
MADLYASRAPVRLNDGTADANNAVVMNSAPAGTEYALVVRALMPTSTVVDTELPAAAALTADAVASPTAPAAAGFIYGYNGTTWDRVKVANTGRLQVDVVTGGGGTPYVGDAAATATPTGFMTMGLANSAAPTDVTANSDAVAQWFLRNGSAVMNLASGGTLITVGGKTAAASFPVVLPTDGYGSGGAAAMHVVLGTGAADYSLFGQAAASAPFARITDATTTVGVIVGTSALKADLSSVAGTATVTGGIAGLQAIGGATAADAAIAAQPITVGARASTATPTAMTADGDVVNLWASLNGALNVTLRDASGTYVGAGGGSQYVGDAAITATPTGTVALGLAHAAAPADVSADNDAVAQWMLRNGSAVVNLASGGTLVTLGAKAMTGSLPVVLPTDGVLADATHPGYVRLTDGAAALIGQKAMAASLPVVIASDQSSITMTDSKLPAAAALADTTANPTLTGIGAYAMGYNGTTWDRVRTANTGRLQVDVVTGGGSAPASGVPTGYNAIGLYGTSAAVAGGATQTAVVTNVPANTKAFYVRTARVVASGQTKWQVKFGAAVLDTGFNAQTMLSQTVLYDPPLMGTGDGATALTIDVTNREASAMDVYAALRGWVLA